MNENMTLKLDATYSSYTEGHLDDWREQCKSNENFIVEAAKAHKFSPECIKWAKGEFYNCSQFALAEFVFLGCKAFGAVAVDHDGSVDTRVFLVTPNNFYSGQGFYTYSSRNDQRHQEIDAVVHKQLDGKEGLDARRVVVDGQKAHRELNFKIWLEQTEYLFAQ